MGRRRRRRSRGGLSRRRFLAGGLLSLGGASILGGTQAFSQVDATRATSVQTTDDQNALLGIDTVQSVRTNVDDQELVTLTNNTSVTLDITISLENQEQGTLAPTEISLTSGSSETVSVSVSADSPTGSDALPFSITAEDNEGVVISLTRAVAVVPGPELLHYVSDKSANEKAQYTIQFDVNNLPDFDRIEIGIQSPGYSDSATPTSREGSVSFSKGGQMGETFEITLDVYNTQNQIALQETITDTADGNNPSNNDELGGPNSSELHSFTLYDSSENNKTIFDLEYEVTAEEEFKHVLVTFKNTEKSSATRTREGTTTPDGSVSYSRGGSLGHEYDIIVEIINSNDIVVDSGSIEGYESNSEDSVSWP